MMKEDKIEDDERISVKEISYDGEFNEDDYIDVPPDGGYGWFCCLYITLINFTTWGPNSAFGIFLSFYLSHNVFDASPTEYAIIGGLIVFLTLVMLPYSAIFLFKFGYRTTVSIAIVLMLAGYIGASFVNTTVGLFFTQGVLVGTAYGITFGANSIVLPSWFLKKRALANGISHAGIGFGGVAFSLIVHYMIQRTGNQKWVLRVIGIISFVICTTCMLLIKIRTPKNSKFKKDETITDIFKKIFDYRIVFNKQLILICVWSCITASGYIICSYSLSNYTISMGFNTNQAMVVTVLFNLGQGFGRPSIGFLSDYFGRINFTIFGSFYMGLIVFLFWINLQTFVQLCFCSFMIGLGVGIGPVNLVPLVADVVGFNGYASAISFSNFFNSIFYLTGEIIALNLRNFKLHDPYLYCQIYVGSCFTVSAIVLLPYREWRIKRVLNSQGIKQDDSIKSYLKRVSLYKKV